MFCPLCASSNQSEFAAEVNIHLSGSKNVNKPTVLIFSKLLVCLDCGSSQFTTPKAELALVATGTATSEA